MNNAASVEAVLDPLLTGKGFAAGQDGGNGAEESTDIIWCAAYEQFQHRFPWLPQSTGQDEFAQYACVDLVVTLSLGKIVRVDLEGKSLEETFLATGHPSEAQRASALIGAPAQDGSQQLASLLTTLLAG